MEFPAAQDQHRWLAQLVGDWQFAGKASDEEGKACESSGTERVRPVGDLWVLCEGETEMPGGSRGQMLMTLGYDPARKAFVGTWVGSMMTHLWVYEGTLDDAGRVLTLESEGPSFQGDGSLAFYRDVITLVGPDERLLTSFVRLDDGQWQQFMESVYRRTRRA